MEKTSHSMPYRLVSLVEPNKSPIKKRTVTTVAKAENAFTTVGISLLYGCLLQIFIHICKLYSYITYILVCV